MLDVPTLSTLFNGLTFVSDTLCFPNWHQFASLTVAFIFSADVLSSAPLLLFPPLHLLTNHQASLYDPYVFHIFHDYTINPWLKGPWFNRLEKYGRKSVGSFDLEMIIEVCSLQMCQCYSHSKTVSSLSITIIITSHLIPSVSPLDQGFTVMIMCLAVIWFTFS